MGRELVVGTRRSFRGGPSIETELRLGLEPPPVLVLFGPSGAGKTTILRQIAGLDRPDEGRITFDGEIWSDTSSRTFIPPQKRRIGLLFQDYALFPHLSVRGNLAYGLQRDGGADPLNELISLLRLDAFVDRRPAELSGGQKQRVALARTLASKPRLLLLDEPLSALDAPSREELRVELRSLLRRLGIPTILVTHDRIEALALGDRVAVLSEGRIRQCGPVADVFSNPESLDVARTVGVETVVEAKIVARDETMVTLRAGRALLHAVAPPVETEEVFVCIRADEVTLEPRGARQGSARNHLDATITAMIDEGAVVRVVLDCGFRLVAWVTRPAVREMDLRLGTEVVATIKATALRLVER